MTATTPHPAQNAPREDDGYFGPGSVSWKVYADPSSRVAGMAGLLLQALNPGMMRLFEHASAAYVDPKGRDERTGRYLDTVMFGDKAHADAAAASVRRMHAHAVWDDPHTGTTLRAEEPAWIDWTHNALAFALLRGAEAFGLDLTPANRTSSSSNSTSPQSLSARTRPAYPRPVPTSRRTSTSSATGCRCRSPQPR